MTRRLLPLALLALILLGLAPPVNAQVRIVATVPDLAALAKEVAGDKATITSLSLPTQDPHFVDAKPSLALAVSRADLLLAVGLELEVGWLPTLQTGSRNPRIQMGAPGYLDCSRFVRLLEVPAQAIDRSMGDIHPGGNPHYLYDPRAAAAVARGIAERLGRIDPAHAQAYLANAEDFVRRLDRARARWEAQLAALKGANVVAYHKSFPYLADWVGFRVVEHIEPKPGIPPTPAHVAHVLATVRRLGVRLILQEEYYPDTTGRLIADRAGVRLVKVPGGADFRAGETYIQHMEEVVGLLREAAGT